MEILEIESEQFKLLNLNLDSARNVGEYEKQGNRRKVLVVQNFVIVNLEDEPSQVGVLETESELDAMQYASKILKRASSMNNSNSKNGSIILTR